MRRPVFHRTDCILCTVCRMKYDAVNMDKRRLRPDGRGPRPARPRGAGSSRRAEASFEDGPLAAVRIDDVARRAGVSRSTVYQLFESRRRAARRAGASGCARRPASSASSRPRAPRRARVLPPRTRESCRDVRACPGAGRALFTLAGVDADARRGGRRSSRTAAARACATSPAASTRRASCATASASKEAAHLLTVVTSFPAFDELYHAVGLPVDVVADRLIALGERAVCRDA